MHDGTKKKIFIYMLPWQIGNYYLATAAIRTLPKPSIFTFFYSFDKIFADL